MCLHGRVIQTVFATIALVFVTWSTIFTRGYTARYGRQRDSGNISARNPDYFSARFGRRYGRERQSTCDSQTQKITEEIWMLAAEVVSARSAKRIEIISDGKKPTFIFTDRRGKDRAKNPYLIGVGHATKRGRRMERKRRARIQIISCVSLKPSCGRTKRKVRDITLAPKYDFTILWFLHYCSIRKPLWPS